MQGPYRVLLVDDDANVRGALQLLLSREPGFVFAPEASAAAQLVEAANAHRPHVILLDCDLPGLDPADLAGIRARCPNIVIIAMSTRPEPLAEPLARQVDAVVNKMDGAGGVQGALKQLLPRTSAC